MNHAFNYQKLMIWDIVKSPNKSILVKKKQALSGIRNTVIPCAENFILLSIYKTKSGKESIIDQDLDICNRKHKIATHNLRKVCVKIKKYNVNKPPYFQSRLFTAKVNEDLKETPCVNYTSNDFEELSQTLEDFMSVVNFKPQ